MTREESDAEDVIVHEHFRSVRNGHLYFQKLAIL
jgi:hypothetical protein